jgi:hypothetical protein
VHSPEFQTFGLEVAPKCANQLRKYAAAASVHVGKPMLRCNKPRTAILVDLSRLLSRLD